MAYDDKTKEVGLDQSEAIARTKELLDETQQLLEFNKSLLEPYIQMSAQLIEVQKEFTGESAKILESCLLSRMIENRGWFKKKRPYDEVWQGTLGDVEEIRRLVTRLTPNHERLVSSMARVLETHSELSQRLLSPRQIKNRFDALARLVRELNEDVMVEEPEEVDDGTQEYIGSGPSKEWEKPE